MCGRPCIVVVPSRPELGSRGYATILRDPGWQGPPRVGSRSSCGLDVPRRSTVAGWHLEQSVRPTGVTDDGCPSRLSGGKRSDVTLDTAPAMSGGTSGGLPSRPLWSGVGPFWRAPMFRRPVANRLACCMLGPRLLACCSLPGNADPGDLSRSVGK